jgi:hypothetical protein
VHVDVDQAGAYDEARGVHHVGRAFFVGAEGVDELAVARVDVAHGVALVGRVDDPPVAYPEKVAH